MSQDPEILVANRTVNVLARCIVTGRELQRRQTSVEREVEQWFCRERIEIVHGKAEGPNERIPTGGVVKPL